MHNFRACCPDIGFAFLCFVVVVLLFFCVWSFKGSGGFWRVRGGLGREKLDSQSGAREQISPAPAAFCAPPDAPQK